MTRTLNGEILIDDAGNFNEGLWLENLIACAELLKKQKESDEANRAVLARERRACDGETK